MSEPPPSSQYIPILQPCELDSVLSRDLQQRLAVAIFMGQQDTLLGNGGWFEVTLVGANGRIIGINLILKERWKRE